MIKKVDAAKLLASLDLGVSLRDFCLAFVAKTYSSSSLLRAFGCAKINLVAFDGGGK